MITEEINALIEKHKLATEREKAKIEVSLWDAADAEERTRVGRRRYIKSFLPKVGHTAELRFQLHNAGEAIEELWDRIEGAEKMPLPTAVGRLHAGQEYAQKNNLDLKAGVAVALKEYDSWPWTKTRNGGKFRKRPLSQISRANGKPRSRAPLSEEKVKKFWLRLREEIVVFMEKRLTGVDALLANELQRSFCTDLQILCEDFSHKIDRARRAANATAETNNAIRFVRVRDACATLAMDAPEQGQPLDLEKANKNKKMLAKKYHSDAVGDDSKRDQFNAVIEAYGVLEDYMESINNG